MGDRAVAKNADSAADFQSFVNEYNNMRVRTWQVSAPPLQEGSDKAANDEQSKPSYGIYYGEED